MGLLSLKLGLEFWELERSIRCETTTWVSGGDQRMRAIEIWPWWSKKNRENMDKGEKREKEEKELESNMDFKSTLALIYLSFAST